MNIENTQSQMRKGILEFCILSIIRRGEAYPSDIVEEMRGANLQILEGTLYPLLTRLKNADMLTYRWVESNSGPPRKYFSQHIHMRSRKYEIGKTGFIPEALAAASWLQHGIDPFQQVIGGAFA